MAGEKKRVPEQLSLIIMAFPLDEESRDLSGEALLRHIAEKARLQNRADQYLDAPRARTYGGRVLWQIDLQRPPSNGPAFMREVIFAHEDLLVVMLGGAPDRAALDKLETVYATLRFSESRKPLN